jgi:hypothetical protein
MRFSAPVTSPPSPRGTRPPNREPVKRPAICQATPAWGWAPDLSRICVTETAAKRT